MMGFFACVYAVNRRVGGLEIIQAVRERHAVVNRRVGGLENRAPETESAREVNRRVGGLEMISAIL